MWERINISHHLNRWYLFFEICITQIVSLISINVTTWRFKLQRTTKEAPAIGYLYKLYCSSIQLFRTEKCLQSIKTEPMLKRRKTLFNQNKTNTSNRNINVTIWHIVWNIILNLLLYRAGLYKLTDTSIRRSHHGGLVILYAWHYFKLYWK